MRMGALRRKMPRAGPVNRTAPRAENTQEPALSRLATDDCVPTDRGLPRGQGPEAHPAIRLDRVTCRIGGAAILRDLSINFDAGVVTGVLGPNGAGKSTALGLIMGLRPLSGGAAEVLGVRLPARGRDLRRRIGVVLQETALYEELTAYENLHFAASLYGVTAADRRIHEVLDLLGLADRARDVVGALSGGMRRRISIARALLHAPELLIIDEPTLGVDVDTRHAIWSHIRVLRARGTTVVVATNYLDEAEALCDVVAVLRDGRLVAFESPASLVARAGRCVDVDCTPHEVTLIGNAVAGLEGVLRVDRTPSGAAVFLEGGAPTHAVVRSVIRSAPSIGGVRVRAADLAEVFRALAVTV
jgi:ABC-2 type transport system ATP-binding protein